MRATISGVLPPVEIVSLAKVEAQLAWRNAPRALESGLRRVVRDGDGCGPGTLGDLGPGPPAAAAEIDDDTSLIPCLPASIRRPERTEESRPIRPDLPRPTEPVSPAVDETSDEAPRGWSTSEVAIELPSTSNPTPVDGARGLRPANEHRSPIATRQPQSLTETKMLQDETDVAIFPLPSKPEPRDLTRKCDFTRQSRGPCMQTIFGQGAHIPSLIESSIPPKLTRQDHDQPLATSQGGCRPSNGSILGTRAQTKGVRVATRSPTPSTTPTTKDESLGESGAQIAKYETSLRVLPLQIADEMVVEVSFAGISFGHHRRLQAIGGHPPATVESAPLPAAQICRTETARPAPVWNAILQQLPPPCQQIRIVESLCRGGATRAGINITRRRFHRIRRLMQWECHSSCLVT